MAPPALWAVIPAAGIGRRMGTERPKQYLELRGRAVVTHAIERVARHPRVAGALVAVAPDDRWWAEAARAVAPAPERVSGGPERCHSVLNALARLAERAPADDWVLVHDAVRPCVRREALDRLIEAGLRHRDGALLATPVRDTIKRVDVAHAIVETVDRRGLWQAQTPQMFPLGRLRAALEAAVGAGVLPTDEAQAMEMTGAHPLVVEGGADNIKITTPGDMALAEVYLSREEAR